MKYMTFLEPAMMSHVVGILLKEGQPMFDNTGIPTEDEHLQ
jgi:hypothetical protein